MAADRQPPSRDDIPEAALAALTEDDIPPDEDCLGWPDRDTASPPELADLTTPELEELIAAQPDPVADIGPAGFWSRDRSGGGCGFADGGELDVLGPGVPLAGFTDDAHARLAVLTDDELIGVLRSWRRQTSWAQARELAAVAELARRRPSEGTPSAAEPGGFPAAVSEFTADEIAMALTLTGRAAGDELDLALDLATRPATAAALEAGEIDLPRAKIMVSLLGPLSAEHAAAVETQILPRAAAMTTGQLRAALQRAVVAADPDAARRRREEAEREARVEHWAEPEGTASLAGRGLPPAAALTASSRLTQIATAWKKHGAQGGMDLLRAHAYLALLNGQPVDAPPPGLLPATVPGGSDAGRPGTAAAAQTGGPAGASAPGPEGCPAASGTQALPAGLRGPGPTGPPPAAGLINLTVPLTTLLGLAHAPGEVAGHGPLDADAIRLLARTLAGQPATRWQITITSPDGHALAHGTARRSSPGGTRAKPGVPSIGPPSAGAPSIDRPTDGPPGAGTPGIDLPSSGPPGAAPPSDDTPRDGPANVDPPSDDTPGTGWAIAVTAEPITSGRCGHRNAETGYRPSPALQGLIRARTVTCAGPGCRRPAARCDLDHTTPHDHGGITCECNLGPACRHCHRRKQTPGWKLTQSSPGMMTWTTPAGRRYTTLPSKHPT